MTFSTARVLLLLLIVSVAMGFAPPNPIPKSTALHGILKPSKEQQEQLDKYGQTPETSLEMMFDTLADENNPITKVFLHFQPQDKKEKWKKFLGGLKENKEQSKLQEEARLKRKQQKLEEEKGEDKDDTTPKEDLD